MSKLEKRFRKMCYASLGAMAEVNDRISNFFDEETDDDHFRELVERGKKLVDEGKETNAKLRHKAEERFDRLVDDHRNESKMPDVAAMTKEERLELLEKLKAFMDEES